MESTQRIFRVRASQLGQIMTESRKKGELSQTAKSAVLMEWMRDRYGYEERVYSDAMRKGTEGELDAIALWDLVAADGMNRVNSEWRKTLGKQTYYENEYVHGTPDIVLPDCVEDIKCSQNMRTFFTAEMTKDYEYQLRAYMWLTGLKKARLVYCLLPDPEWLMAKRLRQVEYNVGFDRELDEQDFIIRQNDIIKEMNPRECVRVFSLDHDDEIIEKIKERIDECREYYDTIKHQAHPGLNNI